MQLWACFLLRENDLCRWLPKILARIPGRGFALDQGHLEPAKSWESPNQKSRSLQPLDFISAPFSAPVSNPAARSAAQHIHPSFGSQSLPAEGASQGDASRLVSLPRRVPARDAHPRARPAAARAAAGESRRGALGRAGPRAPAQSRTAHPTSRKGEGPRLGKPPAAPHPTPEPRRAGP